MAKPSRPGHRLASILLWALAPAVAASACGSGSSSPPTSPTSASVTSVNISGTANFTEAGQTAQLAATATFSDNTKQDVTATAAWRSLNASVATVSGTGLVTALGLGAASITATFQGKNATLPVSVTASHGQIATCGVFSGPGPFTVATDIRRVTAFLSRQNGLLETLRPDSRACAPDSAGFAQLRTDQKTRGYEDI